MNINFAADRAGHGLDEVASGKGPGGVGGVANDERDRPPSRIRRELARGQVSHDSVLRISLGSPDLGILQ